jgi:hypothetical protein
MQLEVLAGSYKITSGATLRAGSSIRVSEDWLTFPAGLVIEVGTGGVELKGQEYAEGTRLEVSPGGSLTVLEP